MTFKCRSYNTVVLVFYFAVAIVTVNSFHSPTFHITASCAKATFMTLPKHSSYTALYDTTASLDDDNKNTEDKNDENAGADEITIFLQTSYPLFYSLLVRSNEEIISYLRVNDGAGCTFFAPSDDVFTALEQQKLLQLKDDRNGESTAKMAGYHFVPTEALTDAQLRTEDWTVPKKSLGEGQKRPLTIGGVLTLSGELRVGRSKSGGFLGFGAREDGSIVVGTDAKITKSSSIGNCVVHEVDQLVSPQLLWRYFDQLRIPGF